MMLDHLDHLDDPDPPAPDGERRQAVAGSARRQRRTRRNQRVGSALAILAAVALAGALLIPPSGGRVTVTTAVSSTTTRPAPVTTSSTPATTTSTAATTSPTPSSTTSSTARTSPTSAPVEVLAPARVPAVGPLCSQRLVVATDGTAGPLLCADGALNRMAWAYDARIAVSLMALGRGATQADVVHAACQDLQGSPGPGSTFPFETDAYTLAATYYGWSPRFDLGNLLVNGGVCDTPTSS